MKMLTVAALALVFGLAAGGAAKGEAKTATLPGAADESRLKQLVEGLAYDLTADADSVCFPVKVGRWTHHFHLSISANRSIIWVNVYVAQAKGPIPGAVLEKMLKKNADMSPALFKASGDKIFLSSLMPNTAVTPKTLKAFIEHTVANLEGTEDLWDERKWEEVEY